jgi:hypothetical protein
MSNEWPDIECIKGVEIIPVAGFTRIQTAGKKEKTRPSHANKMCRDVINKIDSAWPMSEIRQITYLGKSQRAHRDVISKRNQEVVIKMVAGRGSLRFGIRPNRWYYIYGDSVWERITYKDIGMQVMSGLSSVRNGKLIIYVRKIEVSEEQWNRLHDAVIRASTIPRRGK